MNQLYNNNKIAKLVVFSTAYHNTGSGASRARAAAPRGAAVVRGAAGAVRDGGEGPGQLRGTEHLGHAEGRPKGGNVRRRLLRERGKLIVGNVFIPLIPKINTV